LIIDLKTMRDYFIIKGIKILFFGILFFLLLGTVVMVLWNWLMPTLFNLPHIDFAQAIGLTILTRILAGGFRIGMATGSKEDWDKKRQMWEKFKNMSPDERIRWKEEWRMRCRTKMGYKRYDEDTNNDQI
jgi:Ca2+/H+ antiporter, TMEM165/GDT1 family